MRRSSVDAPLLNGLLDALPSHHALAAVVPRVLATLEREPLACGGRFPGDLLRALMEIGGTYWTSHEEQYERYRAVVRQAALERRGGAREQYEAFWSELPLGDRSRFTLEGAPDSEQGANRGT